MSGHARHTPTEGYLEESAGVGFDPGVHPSWVLSPSSINFNPLLFLQEQRFELILEVVIQWVNLHHEGGNEENEILDADYVAKHGCDTVDLAVLDSDLLGEVKDESSVCVLSVVSVYPVRGRLFLQVEVGELMRGPT